MILLDTTILVYAVGAEHPLRRPCAELIAAIGEGDVAATTTVEVLQEFTHVRARRRGRADAVNLAESYAALLTPLVQVDRQDLATGLGLYRASDRLGCFDAVLAAVGLRRDHITVLASADQAFSEVKGLNTADPRTADWRHATGLSTSGTK